MFDHLKQGIRHLGKPQWQPVLQYVAQLHEKCTRSVEEPFQYPWEEIGLGYVNGPAFGHIDITHQALDTVAYEPQHAIHQILNNLALETPDGLVPGAIWMRDKQMKQGVLVTKPDWNPRKAFPPFWPAVIEEHSRLYDTDQYIRQCYDNLIRQIGWFERNRAAGDGGYYYLDMVERRWESGVDDGVRYIDAPKTPHACVDATSHVYMLYRYACRWARRLDLDDPQLQKKASALEAFIQNRLFCEETGFFHDIWSVNDPSRRHTTFEGMWPMVAGAATQEQAKRVIDENLLNEKRFFSLHPITTVSMEDPLFELRMWRGPVWNCMTMWAARGCMGYGRTDASEKLLERAIDVIAAQYEKTGTVWEFYHPFIGDQMQLERKPYTPNNTPCRDYLGHMPVIYMARLWEASVQANASK
jgi:putative isomerase